MNDDPDPVQAMECAASSVSSLDMATVSAMESLERRTLCSAPNSSSLTPSTAPDAPQVGQDRFVVDVGPSATAGGGRFFSDVVNRFSQGSRD